MVYVVKYKGEGRTQQTILRICTLKDECYKKMSNGESHRKRDCEYWPTCKSQRHAELIAYRPVVCNGVKVPRIMCQWDGNKWAPRQVGAKQASASAIASRNFESKTREGYAATIANRSARKCEIAKYDREYRKRKSNI